jgi:hypothetical protein
MSTRHGSAFAVLALGLATACSSGGGSNSLASLPTSPSQATQTASGVTLSATSETTAPLPTVNGIGGSVTFSPATGSLAITASTQPSSSITSQVRAKQSSGTLNIYYLVTITAPINVSLSALPSFSITVPQTIPTSGQLFYYGISNPAATTPGLSFQTQGPAAVSGSTLTFAASPTPLTFTKGQSYTFAFYSVSGTSAPQSLYFIDNAGNINIVPITATGAASPTFTIPASGVPTNGAEGAGLSLAVDSSGAIYAPGPGSHLDIFGYRTTSPSQTIAVPLPPRSVAVSASGDIYVLVATLSGASSSIFVYTQGATQPFRTITGTNTGLTSLPSDLSGESDATQIAVDASDNSYVSNSIDSENFGQSDLGVLEIPPSANGNPTIPVVTPFLVGDDPTGLAVTADGNTIYLCDRGPQIAVYSRSGSLFTLTKKLGVASGTQIYHAVAVDASGLVYGLQATPVNGSPPGASVDVFPSNASDGAAPLRSFSLTFNANSVTAGP